MGSFFGTDTSQVHAEKSRHFCFGKVAYCTISKDIHLQKEIALFGGVSGGYLGWKKSFL
jgi:hypothetical protein